MESPSRESMTTQADISQTPRAQIARTEEQLSQLFGSYKAEWLKDKIFDLFKEPAYFPDLTTASPCLLVGGRGTGKTTVLRCLSYEGQFALSKSNSKRIAQWNYFGMYYRVNTNRVTAFKGEELPEARWVRLFAHYFNLLLCDMIFNLLDWYALHSPDSVELGGKACLKIGKTLHLNNAKTVRELEDHVENSRIEFEAYINNVADGHSPPLTLQAAPVDALMEAILELPQFQGRNFFFLLDEYENFEDYQQQVVNTFIKHSGQLYSFKIGVKELGWRRRTTLQENEQLVSPADYVRINISDTLKGDKFKRFARKVCNERFAKLQGLEGEAAIDVENLLPALSDDDEANLLGAEKVAANIKRGIAKDLSPQNSSALDELSSLEVYFLKFWAEGQNHSVIEVFRESLKEPERWRTRYENYKHALLFTLRKHVSGINKYYAGWDVFSQLAANNIRYLLELVEKSIVFHLHDGGNLTQQISPRIQTLTAQNVGRNYLTELEGLSVHGAQLTKLLLGLGRVFQVMARDAIGHAPEVNQFHLADASDVDLSTELGATHQKDVERLLTSAVMHLALIRSTGNKLGDAADTKDYDYMVHPIYSAFFVFSHRRKRKMLLSGSQLMGLVNNPKVTIREILRNNNRIGEEPLLEQLGLFEAYYHGSSGSSDTN
jgi:hypothetical protein